MISYKKFNTHCKFGLYSVINSFGLFRVMSQTLFGNPKGPVEIGNPNTCAETKLCLILFYYGSRNSLAMSLKFLYSWFKRKPGLVRWRLSFTNKQKPLSLIKTNVS